MCVAYELDGRRIRNLPARQSELARVGARLRGAARAGATSLRHVRERHELPAEAAAYLRFVEEEIGVPVTFVGVGPERDEYVRYSTVRPSGDGHAGLSPRPRQPVGS